MSEYVFYTTAQAGFKPKAFDPNDHINIIDYIKTNDGKDTYRSINIFSSPTSKTKENVAALVSIIMDVEVVGHAYDLNYEDAEQLFRHIKKEFDITIPTPTAFIHSGRGIHIAFDIDKSTDLQKYQIVFKRLRSIVDKIVGEHNALYNLKTDTSVDYWSYIRVEGTYNTKAGTYSKTIFHSKARYTLDNLIERYIGDLSDIVGEGIKQRTKTEKLHRKEFKTHKREFKSYRKGFTAKTLQEAVFNDLEKLRELRSTRIEQERNGNYKLKANRGDRNQTLFIYAVYAKYYYQDTNKAYKALQRFNERFKPEPLEENELNTIFNSSLKSNYTTRKLSTIAEKLKLSEEEMRHMTVLFDANEKKRRQKERERERTESRRDAKREIIAKCKELKQSGYNTSQIALKLKLSRPTVNKYLCQ